MWVRNYFKLSFTAIGALVMFQFLSESNYNIFVPTNFEKLVFFIGIGC